MKEPVPRSRGVGPAGVGMSVSLSISVVSASRSPSTASRSSSVRKLCESSAGPNEGEQGYCLTRTWVIDGKPFAAGMVSLCGMFASEGKDFRPTTAMLAALREVWGRYA